MAKCKCGTKARIVSGVVQSMQTGGSCPQDVCANPICGDPDMLSIFAPLIYDEIGINLCTTFPLGVTISTDYPTAVNARAQVVNATYTYGTGNVVIETISGRPNCSVVTLSNICVEFAVSLYDNSCRLLGTELVTAVYLPSLATAATYDEETNPSSVELEIFTPYGVSYSDAESPSPVINYIGFTAGSNTLAQGLNMYGMAKIIDLDVDESTVTMGLTIVLQSLYFVGYKVHSKGKIEIPKGCIISQENSDCRRFVAGDLLNLEIKPLDLGAPFFEERDKVDRAQVYPCGTCRGTCSPWGNCTRNNGAGPINPIEPVNSFAAGVTSPFGTSCDGGNMSAPCAGGTANGTNFAGGCDAPNGTNLAGGCDAPNGTNLTGGCGAPNGANLFGGCGTAKGSNPVGGSGSPTCGTPSSCN